MLDWEELEGLAPSADDVHHGSASPRARLHLTRTPPIGSLCVAIHEPPARYPVSSRGGWRRPVPSHL
jgi:hypothetical protein